MPIAASKKDPWYYVLECDRKKPQPEQTRFRLRALSGDETLALLGLTGGAYLRSILMFSLIGWDNFRDDKGKAIPFKADDDGHALPEMFDYLLDPDHGSSYIAELAIAARAQNEITEDERKNSLSGDTLSPDVSSPTNAKSVPPTSNEIAGAESR